MMQFEFFFFHFKYYWPEDRIWIPSRYFSL